MFNGMLIMSAIARERKKDKTFGLLGDRSE